MLDWSTAFNISINIIHLTAVIGTMLVVILDNRHPVKTIAWILVLLFLPIVGLVAYFFFGQNIRKKRLISKRSYLHIARKPLRGFWRKPPTNLPEKCRTLANLFRRMNHSMPFSGNHVEVFTEGAPMIQQLLRCIHQAQHHIHLEYYILEDDAVGRLVRDLLMDKARQGIKVRIIYDDVGCWKVKNRFFKHMNDVGIEVHPFLPVYFPMFSNKVNYRNHRKIAVIDGRTGFIGGMNLATRYVKGLPWGHWRDTTLRIDGQAVQALQTVFLMDWCFTTRELISDRPYFPSLDTQGNSQIQIVISKPVGRWHDIMQGFLCAIGNAQRYIYIQTPYFMPTEQICTALQTAALAGIDVRIMIPWRADSRMVQMCSRSFLRDMMEAGVKILFYNKGFLHSKLMVIDDCISTIGSTNMDFRSFEYNFEANAFMYDTETAIRLRNIFTDDQQHCTHISSQRWAKRSRWRKIEESFFRLLAPLM